MPLSPGQTLGPYQITGLLGAGGMGEVYRAIDSRLRREVAVKVLPSSVAHDVDRIARFEQEARATAALNHPNIVAVYDIGSDGAATFVVSELLNGATLRDRLREGPLPLRKVLQWAADIVNGLAAAHERGIAHRDLKPENIFVTADGPVKILDFGLAKLTEAFPSGDGRSVATVTSAHTGPGLVLGTVGYMAPEQVRGLSADHRADIFAFGAILYETLAGRRAFGGATTADAISAVLSSDPPELPAGGVAVPAALDTIMRRCLEKDPHDRFQSARDLGFALEAVSTRASDVSTLARPFRRRVSSRALVGAGLVAVAILAAAWWLSPSALVARPQLAVSVTLPPDTAMDGPPVVSPDGRAIAFAAFDAEGVRRVWLRTLDTYETRVLAGSDGGDSPFWSADGRSLGFFARGKLWRLDLSGGPPRPLAVVSDPRGGTWSHENTIVYAPQPDGALYRISADGGTPVSVTTLDRAQQEISHRWPRFLPDGRHVVFMNRVTADTVTRYVVSVVPIDGGPVKRLLEAESTGVYEDGRLLFLRDDKVFAQPFDPVGAALSGEPLLVADKVWNNGAATAGLVGFDAAGGVVAWRPAVEGVPRTVWKDRAGLSHGTVGPAGDVVMVPSPDGRLVVFAQRDAQMNATALWLADLARGTTRRFTAPDSSSTSPVWSPDGRRIVYSLLRAGSFDLYIKDVAPGGAQRLLLHTDGMKAAQSWSPDGEVILFAAVDPKRGLDLWSLELRPGSTPRVFAGGDADQCCGRFSPDGQWVAYVATDTGRPEVYVKSFSAPGDAVQVSVNGGGAPAWRDNGRELYYVAPDNRLMSVPVTMDRGAFKAGTPVPLFRLNTPTSRGSVADIADDRPYAAVGGDRFLVTETPSDARAATINLLLNWTPARAR